MDSQSNIRRMNVQSDRLSSLPDDLIAKILSYNSIKQAIETSVLSSRWRSIWTSVPYLNFSIEDFSNKTPKFYRFLTHVFFACNNQVEFSLNLCGKASQVFVKRILNETFSRNVQKLTFAVVQEKGIELDLSRFSSQSLKQLSLITPNDDYFHCITPTSMWELPALTTLHLSRFSLYDDNINKCFGLFSKCPNLKNLTLDNCLLLGKNLTICHPHISNLTIKNMTYLIDGIKVVTSQLKNLTIVNCEGELMISAPNLTCLIYKSHPLQFSVDIDSLPSLEKADLCVRSPFYDNGTRKVVNFLQKFYNVRFLRLNLEIIEILCSSVKLIAHQPSPFLNLKSLSIYPELLNESFKGEVNIPTEVKNYFLGSSPSAIFTMVSRKELRAVRDVKLAQDLMEKLRVLLNREKEAQMKSHKAMIKLQHINKKPLNVSERVTQIESYWVDLNEQIDNGKTKTIPIIKLIKRIKDLLMNLPISKTAEMQPDFSSLCAEADTVMDEIIKRMKIECVKNGSRLGVCVHELVTAAKSSS